MSRKRKANFIVASDANTLTGRSTRRKPEGRKEMMGEFRREAPDA